MPNEPKIQALPLFFVSAILGWGIYYLYSLGFSFKKISKIITKANSEDPFFVVLVCITILAVVLLFQELFSSKNDDDK